MSNREVIYRKLSELKKLSNNPRTIKREDMERLKQSLQANPDYFEARPLILSNRTGELVILAGNQRYEAAKALKMDKVPTFLLEGLTEAREREIIIRDNVSNGEWDMEALANDWDINELKEWMGKTIPTFDEDDEQPSELLEEHSDPTCTIFTISIFGRTPDDPSEILAQRLTDADATLISDKIAEVGGVETIRLMLGALI